MRKTYLSKIQPLLAGLTNTAVALLNARQLNPYASAIAAKLAW